MKESPSRRKFESAPQQEAALSPDELEAVREGAFQSIILSTLLETFVSSLEEVGFTLDEVREIESPLALLDFKEATAVLAIPASIRERKLTKLLESVRTGEFIAADVVERLHKEAKERGFGIGYHNSPNEIRPDLKTGEWSIRPTEKDHRDADLPRAYYATSYKTLYRSKHSLKYLYVVRTMNDHVKTDGNWSRTNILSIVEEVPLDRIDKWVDDSVQNTRHTKGKGAATE